MHTEVVSAARTAKMQCFGRSFSEIRKSDFSQKVFFFKCLLYSPMKKNIDAKYTTFRREKWKKYVLPDRKMYVKYIFENIFRIYKENVF